MISVEYKRGIVIVEDAAAVERKIVSRFAAVDFETSVVNDAVFVYELSFSGKRVSRIG